MTDATSSAGSAGSGGRALVQVLSEVPDFRKSQGRRHPLGAVLALACAATLCGYKSYGAMAEWGKNYGAELAQALGFKDGKTPSVGTLFTIFSNLDKRALEAKLAAWAKGVLQQLPNSTNRNSPDRNSRATSAAAIALDGKTLRGSSGQGACDVHLLSAVSHGLGLTLFQEAVSDKTNEIGAVQTVLKALVLEGRIVTMDALLTQKDVARDIRAKGGTS
jgi:hypothetical protein